MSRRTHDAAGGNGQDDADFSVDTEQVSPDCYQLAIRGELDLNTAPILRDALGKLAGQGPRTLILSLEHCTFIDSTGLQVVLHSTREMDHGGTQLLLAGAEGAVRRVLEVSGVSNMVLMYPTLEQARRAAGG